MRSLVGSLCFAIAVSFAVAQDGNEGKGPNKNVEVKVTFPKEATFKAAKEAGGTVGKVTVKVEIKNVSKEGVAVSSAQFDAKVKGPLKASMPKKIDALLLEAGKSITQERDIEFNTVLPKNGEEITIEFYAFGHKQVGKVKAKVK